MSSNFSKNVIYSISNSAKLLDSSDQRSSSLKDSIIRVVSGIFLLFICSQASIELNHVPITMQTAGVLLISLTYRKREALISMSSFLLLGALGLPMFSGLSGGIRCFTGTTGGYFVGMLLCVYIITYLRSRFGEDSGLKLLIYSLIGSAAVFAVGIPYLSYLIGFESAIKFGFVPFIIPGIAKVLFVSSSLRLIRNIPKKN